MVRRTWNTTQLLSTSRLTLRSSGQPPGYQRLPLNSNVRALISRTRRQRFRTNGACSKTAFQSTQVQFAQSPSSSASAGVLWSASELRFALLEKSVNGLRFAHLEWSVAEWRFAPLNSRKVGAPPRRRSPLCHRTALMPRNEHCEGACRSSASQSLAVRRMLRPAMLQPTKFMRFGYQRPNPSIEGMPKRLRLLCTPHVKRVCRAWHESRWVRVPVPGISRAEG